MVKFGLIMKMPKLLTKLGETPIGEPTTITGRCGINNINQDDEGHPCKIFQSY